MKKSKACRLKIVVMSCLLIFIAHLSNPVYAVAKQRGRVSMQGSIVDTACAISLEDRYQRIEISTHPLEQLIHDTQGIDIPFGIHLEACTLHSTGIHPHDWQYFQVTFDGETDDGRLFRINGVADGVGLQITNDQGVVAIPGVPVAPGLLIPGAMTLNYRLRLKANAAHLKVGEYWATIRFKVEYF